MNRALSQKSNCLSVVISLFVLFNRRKTNTFETKPMNSFNHPTFTNINENETHR